MGYIECGWSNKDAEVIGIMSLVVQSTTQDEVRLVRDIEDMRACTCHISHGETYYLSTGITL